MIEITTDELKILQEYAVEIMKNGGMDSVSMSAINVDSLNLEYEQRCVKLLYNLIRMLSYTKKLNEQNAVDDNWL